jgi:hypothetical protein
MSQPKRAGTGGGGRRRRSSSRPRSSSAGGPALQERLADLQRWHRWHTDGPQSTGMARVQQWVCAYAEGVLTSSGKPGDGPPGTILA